MTTTLSFETLEKKLLSLGGERVVDPGIEVDLEILLERGKVFDLKIKMMKGAPCGCHKNTAKLYDKNYQKGFKIVTGYYLLGGLWRQHSFGLYDNKIIETTNKAEKYFGVELLEHEAENFAMANW